MNYVKWTFEAAFVLAGIRHPGRVDLLRAVQKESAALPPWVVESHITRCGRCQQRVEDFRRAFLQLKALYQTPTAREAQLLALGRQRVLGEISRIIGEIQDAPQLNSIQSDPDRLIAVAGLIELYLGEGTASEFLQTKADVLRLWTVLDDAERLVSTFLGRRTAADVQTRIDSLLRQEGESGFTTGAEAVL